MTPIVAILYDFDKTLCTTDMQDYAFIPSLGMTPSEFWQKANRFGWENRMDGILAYMFTMLQESRSRNLPWTRQGLVEKGRSIVLFPGVRDWFRRINAFGASQGVEVEHYIISSGLREIIEGSSISGEFKEIYASEFYYDESGVPVWPKLAVNFTAKTQFVYRINKGVLDVSNDRDLNASMPDDSKRVPFTNMIYMGDGLSDVPCMKMMRAYGGQAIAVYQDGNRPGVEDLLSKGRVDFIFPADYSEGTDLDATVKNIITKMSILDRLTEENTQQLKRIGWDVLPNQASLFEAPQEGKTL
ncbi:haloacid dehalogenase-like hydrolase [Oscillibacter sp. MSJ-2]|uniref:Haloacid dehalogenase-like hydrolase n=1 Tax=Dysosmobacter acutus TaxID=2841504 RepID=A0ABS6F6A9_9FIRM|nr:HAD family hydrolase [Dysosmobacter acutus]MBU5625834.1 haloacid dehalogenase-like hydrolase [Dysosmobacter acutus]